ncbi:DUF1877 family protein [Saccharothrix coeruleofusca]|uniref:DUF1877 family protein n=1 Tax=Saccharothrix coeruleofusca TaxID=33919 RepID=A0A918ALG6_9PSEU|nr:DUF1877 family protein [Saccharothrix coeruleofusca]MBP2336489.1 hypothetical protein [Saccharothrix coeruleofusca]GGP52686.1 hypothetical protein GCM10010185_26000 [Saccharothrix coeruleofusca]
MAVTQQLVRIPVKRLAKCRASVAQLHRVCSLRSVSRADHLDLDWWPAVLERVWERTDIAPAALPVLRRAFHGDEEVNPAYRNHPDTVWEHPVTALEPEVVAEVADALRALSPKAVRAAVPEDSGGVQAVLRGVASEVVGLRDEVVRQYIALRDFYGEAADRERAAVLWWD